MDWDPIRYKQRRQEETARIKERIHACLGDNYIYLSEKQQDFIAGLLGWHVISEKQLAVVEQCEDIIRVRRNLEQRRERARRQSAYDDDDWRARHAERRRQRER